MINTIFYFADTLAEYSDMFSKGLVKPHTICFAKDTKTIWRNGMRFSGLRQDEVDDEIHNLTDEAIGDLNEGVQNLEIGLDTAVQSAAEEKIRLNGEILRIDDLQGVVEWVYSGLHSGASEDMSYAEIIAAGKNGANSAISDLRTSIETTSDGKYVAQTSMTSSVDKAISGIVNAAAGEYANTSVFSQIDTNSDNIAAITTYVGNDIAQTTLAAKLNKAEAGAVATVKDDLASMHILSKSGNNYTADVYTKSQTDGAISSATASMATTDDLQRSMGLVYTKTEADNRTNQLISEAGLVSENEFTAASIITKVNGASSSVKINADHINIDANHQLDLSALTVTVDADDINLNGQTNFENAIGNMITTKSLKISDVNNLITTVIESGNATFSGDVKASTLTAGPEQGMHIVTTGNEIHFMNGNTVMGKFVTEDNGLQMYIMGPDGDLYKVNFNNWTNTSSGGGTSRTYKLYKFTQSGSSTYYNITNYISVYGNDDGVYYSDQSGKHLANLGSSSTTNAYLELLNTPGCIILPNTQSVPGITNVIYTVYIYRDVYFVDGAKQYGPNRYAIIRSGTTDRIYFVKSGTSKSNVYAYNVYTAESAGSRSCADTTQLNFGNGDVYFATTTPSLTPYGSGYITGIRAGQYNGTLVNY